MIQKRLQKAVNKTRNMVNSAPADFYPKVMADVAKKIAKESKLGCKIKGEEFLEDNGMNAMLGVGKSIST